METMARLTHLAVDATPHRDVERRLETALRLAERDGGTLSAVCSAWPGRLSVADAVTLNPLSVVAQEREMRSGVAAVAAAFERLKAGKLVSTRWCADVGEPSAALLDHAWLADLVIMSAASSGDFAQADPLEIAARSGAPVLRLGGDAQTYDFERVVVGWKDSRQARSALRAALPLLQQAGKVFVAGVGEEASVDRLGEIGDYLSDHGLEPRIAHLEGGRASPGAMLADLARSEGCDLIIAGARAGGLWKERIFGGATRDLLEVTDLHWLLAS